MIYYLLLTFFAIRATQLLFKGRLVTVLGINLNDPSFDSGSESAEHIPTLNSAKDALEIGSDGAGSVGAQLTSSIRGLSGVTMVEQWEITSDNTSGGDITSNLQKRQESFAADFGGSMTESSGVFTFPSTGYYEIIFEAGFRRDESDGNANSVLNEINVSTDSGSSFSRASFGQTEIIVDASAFSWFQYCSTSFFIDIQDTATDKVKFSVILDGASRLLSGNTSFKFKRLGDL